MKWQEKINSWPDKKKKAFSITTAIIITILIAGAWYLLKMKINYFNEPNPKNNRAVEELTTSIGDITKKFDEMKNQYFGTSSATTSEAVSTSSTSTEN